MIHVPITSAMKGKATRSANRMGRIRNSIMRGKGNVYGFLGEQIAQLVLGGELVNKGKKYDVNYDLILDDGTTIVSAALPPTTPSKNVTTMLLYGCWITEKAAGFLVSCQKRSILKTPAF